MVSDELLEYACILKLIKIYSEQHHTGISYSHFQAIDYGCSMQMLMTYREALINSKILARGRNYFGETTTHIRIGV